MKFNANSSKSVLIHSIDKLKMKEGARKSWGAIPDDHDNYFASDPGYFLSPFIIMGPLAMALLYPGLLRRIIK